MESPDKNEIRNTLVSVLIALTPIVILGAIFWHGPKKPESPAVADTAPERDKPPAKSTDPATAGANGAATRKNTAAATEIPAGDAAKLKNVDREKPAPERRRHVSVLPDPQPKTPEASAPTSQAAEPARTQSDVESQPRPVNCEFRKFAQGVVERRTYPTAEMCDQAQKMWRNGFRLLEPDGSVNETHVVKELPRIPGFPN